MGGRWGMRMIVPAAERMRMILPAAESRGQPLRSLACARLSLAGAIHNIKGRMLSRRALRRQGFVEVARGFSRRVNYAGFSTLVATLLLPACTYLVGSWASGPTEAEGKDQVIFSHKRHIVSESLACADCHGDVAKSESLQGARALPNEAACLECHDKKDNCKQCHANPAAPTTWVDQRMPGIKFSHKGHIPRAAAGKAGTDSCLPCHTGIDQHERVSEDFRPGMVSTCSQCHQKDFGKGDCTLCHTQGSLGSAVSVDVFDHGADWLHRHGQMARGGELVCAHCHKQETCAQCHSRTGVPIRPAQLGLDRPDLAQQHRGDFAGRHGMEARLDGKACTTCHQVQDCQSCHQRMGVGPTGAKVNARDPHPAGWSVKGSGQFHGTEVWRDPVGCAVCHDQGAASNCVQCHKVGGSGGNPHPPGWSSGVGRASAGCSGCHGG